MSADPPTSPRATHSYKYCPTYLFDSRETPNMDLPYVSPETRGSTPQHDTTEQTRVGSNSTYLSASILSDTGTNRLLGCGNQIRRVQLVENGQAQGSFYVLKDVWVSHDRVSGDSILAKTETPVPTQLDAFDELDDTSQIYQRLWDSVDSRGPIQPTLSLSGAKRKHSEVIPLGIMDGGREPKRVKTATGYWQHGNQDTFKRSQILFMDVGVAVHDLRNYSDVWTALKGGSEGLHALHVDGFLHRDISSGNIILVGDEAGKQGVIIDLESVKKVEDDSTPHDVKTGTSAFMALEVVLSLYIFIPPLTLSYGQALKTLQPPPFRRNTLHDLESIWWLTAWTAFYLVHPDKPRLPAHHQNYEEVFGPAGDRHGFLTMQSIFLKYVTQFPDGSTLPSAMHIWKDDLQACYRESHNDGEYSNIRIGVIQKAHEAQKEAFYHLCKATQDYPLVLISLSDFDPVPEPKQPTDPVGLDETL